MRSRITFIAIAYGCAPDSASDDITDIATYTARCENVIGSFPSFSAYDGVQVPIEVTSSDLTVREVLSLDQLEDGLNCDRPSPVSGCMPFSRIGSLPSRGTSTYTFIVRTNQTSGSASLFNEIALIAYNPKNGATCFWAGGGHLFDGTTIPKPGSREDLDFFPDPAPDTDVYADVQPTTGIPSSTSFWYSLDDLANSPCTACHDNDPFINTPFAVHAGGDIPSLPFLTYDIVAQDTLTELGSLEWGDARRVAHPDAAPCLECHHLGERFSAGFAANVAGDKTFSFGFTSHGYTQVYRQWPYAYSMLDFATDDVRKRYSSQEVWDAEFREAADTIRACYEGSADEQCWSADR